MSSTGRHSSQGDWEETQSSSRAREVGSFLITVLITMVSTLAIVGVGFGIGFGVWSLVSKGDAANVAEQTAELRASETVPSAAASEPNETSQESSSTSAEASSAAVSTSSVASSAIQASSSASTDLSWRNADFAVDPARTDWNSSGNGRKVVYLTIDDGPSANTQAVLDILDRYGCKATFFVVGHDPDHYYLIKEAYDRGHTIGLHTMSHDYAQIYSSADAYFADLDQIGQVVRDQIGYVPCFIRFPGGSSNEVSKKYAAGIMSQLVGAVQQRGYQYFDWNVSSGDGAEHTADEIYAYSIEGNPPGHYEDNIMLLCHDSAPKQSTVEALPRIIEYYQGMGYSFEALDRSTWACHHGVAN